MSLSVVRLEDASKLAATVGERADSRRFATAATELKQAINTVLWTRLRAPIFGILHRCGHYGVQAGAFSPPREQPRSPTLHASVFSLDRGVVPPGRQERVFQAMLKQEATGNPRVMTYFFLAKQLYGMDEPVYDQRVLDIFREKWAGMVASPWQCSWEDFEGGSKGAYLRDIPGYFLSAYVLGVRRDAPVSSKELRIEPHLADLAAAKGTVVTEYGPVPVAWTKAAAELKFTLTVPPGITTTVALPYRFRSREHPADGKEVKGIHKGNRLEITLSAGDHQEGLLKRR